MPGRSKNYKNLLKDASNLASFYGSHIGGIVCETDGLGFGKDIRKILKFYKNELRLQFHCYILIPRKFLRKTLSEHTLPPTEMT